MNLEENPLTLMKELTIKSWALLRCRSLLLLVSQIILILTSLICAWLLRFDFRLPDRNLLWTAAPVLILVRLLVMPFFNLMHGWWRYTGIHDALDILKATVAGSFAFLLFLRFGLGLASFPLSIFGLEALISFTLLTGVRVLARLFSESPRRREWGSTPKRLLKSTNCN